MFTRLQTRTVMLIVLATLAALLTVTVMLLTQANQFTTLAGGRRPAPPIARLVESGPVQDALDAACELQPNPRVRFGQVDGGQVEPNPRVKFEVIAALPHDHIEAAGTTLQPTPLRLKRG